MYAPVWLIGMAAWTGGLLELVRHAQVGPRSPLRILTGIVGGQVQCAAGDLHGHGL